MKTILINPRTDSRWQAMLERYSSDVFHSPAWIGVIEDTYGLEPYACIVVDNDDTPLAGIPFCQIHDIRGTRRVSLPFSDYCDPLIGSRAHWHMLTEQLFDDTTPFALRCLHNQIPFDDDRLKMTNRAKWHGLDLEPELDTLWSQLHSSARRAIQKAQQLGTRVEIARDMDELRQFFDMHLGLRKYKYRLLAQPYQFFVNIWHCFVQSQNGVLMVARNQGQIIGATLFLEWGKKLFYKFNASLPNALGVRPNDLIIWEAVQYAKSKGYSQLDFGLSDWDQEGLIRFKRKFASIEKTISFMQYAPKPPSDHDLQVRRLLSQLTGLLTENSVPDGITERAGEVLYRYFV